jgi:hypothetical protein
MEISMPLDPRWIWIAVGAVALLVVVGLFARGARRARTQQLRDKFGREYDHVVTTTGSRTRAERELVERAEEVKKFNIRPLTAAERENYSIQWIRVERHFVERPAAAVVEADELVADIMRVEGYPMGDFEKHAAHLSVRHPRVIEHYRAGHRVIGGAPGGATTEDLRQAMLHYRSLFEQLLGEPAIRDVPYEVPQTSEISEESPRRNAASSLRDEDRL